MTELPEIIIYEVTVLGRPAEGLLLNATFGMSTKNSYSFIFGPTDKHGIASLNKATVINRANDQMKLAIMDFHSIENGFSGEVTIAAMSEINILQAIKAFQIYHAVSTYPDGYEAMLKTALESPMLRDFEAINITRRE